MTQAEIKGRMLRQLSHTGAPAFIPLYVQFSPLNLWEVLYHVQVEQTTRKSQRKPDRLPNTICTSRGVSGEDNETELTLTELCVSAILPPNFKKYVEITYIYATHAQSQRQYTAHCNSPFSEAVPVAGLFCLSHR